MKIKFNAVGYHFFASLFHYTKVTGVNSKLPSGKHFLMWDFDNVLISELSGDLEALQHKWYLPQIYILNTGIANYWHAYCFEAVDWGTCLHILADTPNLDWVFFKIGIMRGYFTLRYTKKLNRDFSKAIVLPSKYPETVNPYEACSFITYETKRR